MTLDEAIKHCEEVAEKFDTELNLINCGISNESCDNCLECAKEHRQLAEWLRELKAYRKAEKERPKGEWKHPYFSNIACECSECRMQMPITDYFNFCPNCGADMRGER